MTPMGRQRGFTLIELMVVVSIIGVLAVIGVPHFRAYVLEARLNDAQPMLAEIAAKMRMQFLETGAYCCTSDTTVEANIADELGAPLDEAGDFCFAIICRNGAQCPNVAAADYIAPQEANDADIEFEVWAVLRGSTATTVSAPRSATCTPHPDKRPPTGWVRPNASADAGREGQAVVLRYPPPENGPDATVGADSHVFVWDAGLSKTHALQP